jgi:hypothetical protein
VEKESGKGGGGRGGFVVVVQDRAVVNEVIRGAMCREGEPMDVVDLGRGQYGLATGHLGRANTGPNIEPSTTRAGQSMLRRAPHSWQHVE